MKKPLPLIILALVLVAISFYGGMTYAQKQPRGGNQFANFQNLSPEERAQRFQQMGGQGNRGGGGRMMFGGGIGGGTIGEVLSKDAASLTVKLRDGGSRIVLFSPSTHVSTSIPSATGDVAVGEIVLVMGSPNQDGSVTAQSIQVNPPLPSFPSSSPSPKAE